MYPRLDSNSQFFYLSLPNVEFTVVCQPYLVGKKQHLERIFVRSNRKHSNNDLHKEWFILLKSNPGQR
jgi:hypothetical protein